MNLKKIDSMLFILIVITMTFSQNKINRSRGEPMFECENANTIGAGNVWVSFRALGFIWDADFVGDNDQRPEPFAFPRIEAEIGLFDIASVNVKIRPVSYGWKFGWLSFGSKFTFLKNKDLRFQYVGLKIDYHHSFLEEIGTSIAGYRNTKGTGFSPEGWITAGGNIKILALYDLDFLAKFSWLPLKLSSNIGVRIPFESGFLDYSQYIFSLGVAYIGLGADIFIEYNLEGFANTSADPKQFKFAWPSWQAPNDPDAQYKVWEVAFPENPMYLTIGGRIRYPRGTVLYGALPLLISQNVGSAMTDEDKNGLHTGKFPEEWARGVTDPFDPWYAKWKIIAQVSFPLRYRLTSSEMRRNFLLLKNKKGRKKINIDNRINLKKNGSEAEDEEKKKSEEQVEDQDKKKRLESIKKRRDRIKDSE